MSSNVDVFGDVCKICGAVEYRGVWTLSPGVVEAAKHRKIVPRGVCSEHRGTTSLGGFPLRGSEALGKLDGYQ